MSFGFHMTVLLLLLLLPFFVSFYRKHTKCMYCVLSALWLKLEVSLFCFRYIFLFCITHKKMFFVLQFIFFFHFVALLLFWVFYVQRTEMFAIWPLILWLYCIVCRLWTEWFVQFVCFFFSLAHFIWCGNFIQFKFKPITVWMLLIFNTLIQTSMKQHSHTHTETYIEHILVNNDARNNGFSIFFQIDTKND